MKLVEMPEFNCCGFPIDPVNHEMRLALAARNLCLAEQEELDIMTLCNGCFSTLNETNKVLKENRKTRERVNGYLSKIGMEFKGKIDVKHLVHVLAVDVGFDKLKAAIQRPLTRLILAQHSGCHLLRPAKEVGFDDPENPTVLKNLVEVTGAKCLNYMDETRCCGGPIIGVNDVIPLRLTRDKLHRVKEAGAVALVTVCPFCHMMYDINQPRIERMFNEAFGIPVLHYPQLLGLAMGLNPEELAFRDLRVDASDVLSTI